MKTKEQLKDEKLFADFIEVELFIWEDDEGKDSYFEYYLEDSNLVIFNPEEDWNLLMKAYLKLEDVCNINYSRQHLKMAILCINPKLTYSELIKFIKEYIVNKNANNNQS